MSVSGLSLLVFSDLDGTLIDHHSYSAAPAAPALSKLKTCGAGLIMASSKTAPEIAVIRQALGWDDWPAIVENGAGLLPADDSAAQDQTQYQSLREKLDRLPKDLRQHFRGFGDMTVDDVAVATGLPHQSASLAKDRAYSEPGEWTGTDSQRQRFLTQLAKEGISAREGGRFLTLSFGKSKADQMASLIAHYRPTHTIALGDAPNDIEMLEAADHGVIIANPHRAPLRPLASEAAGRITRTTDAGPEGWNIAILGLLQTLKLA